MKVRQTRQTVIDIEHEMETRSTIYAVAVEQFGKWLMLIYHRNDEMLVVEAISQHDNTTDCVNQFRQWLSIPSGLKEERITELL